MANTIKKTSISYNISRNNNYNVPSVKNNEFVNSLDASSNNVENFDLNDAVDNSYDNDDSNVTYELNSDTSTESINDSSSSNIQESYSDNGNGTTEVNNSNSSKETDVNSVQNGVDSARSNNSNSKTNSEASVSSSQTGVGTETDNNKTNSGTTTSSVPNGVDSATINSDKNSNNNEMSQSSMNDGSGVGTSSNSGTPPIGAYDNNPPVAGGNYPNSGTSSENSSSDGRSDASNGENINNQNINNQNINNNGVSSGSVDNVNSSGNNPDGPWIILTNEEYLKMYQELLDSIEKQIGTDGEISVLLREIRLKYVDYTIMDVDDGMDEKRLNEQIEQQIQAHIDEVDQYVREHSDYNSYAELMQSKAEFEADKAACEQMIKYYTDKPIWEEYYNKLEIAKKEMPPQTGIAGERGLKGDPINKIHRLDSYEEQLIELFGENYKEVFAQYGLDLDFDYVQLYNFLYKYKGPAAAEEFYAFAEDNIKSLAGLVDALEDTSLLSKDKWYSAAMNFIPAHLEGMGTGVVSSFEGVMQWFDESPSKTETDYQSMWYLLMLQTNEFGPEGVLSLSYQVGQGTGQMLPSIAISVILAAVCPESLALPMGIALKGSAIAEFGASAYLFASTGGRDYAEQMQNGMSRDQAILHGIATGGLDVTSEKLLGGLSVFGHDSPYNIKQLVISMIKEGGQEVAQDVLSELLHLGGELPNFESKEEMIEYFKGKGMTFLVAALSAGEIEGPMTTVSIRNIREIYNFIDTGRISEADLANVIRNNIDEDTSKMSDAEVIGKYNEACLGLVNQIRANDVNETNNASDYNQGTVSSNSDNRIYTDENGMQCTKDDFGPNPKKFFDGELKFWNGKGYIDEQTGAYLESLFDGEHDVYIKTIHSRNLDSIYSEGIYCNNNSTLGFKENPKSVEDVNIYNTVTEVDSLFELTCILKSATANGVSQGGYLIDGTLIIVVPKGTDLHQYVYESDISNSLCLSPEIISSFVPVDSNGAVSDPIMYQDYIQSQAEKDRIESIQSDLNMFALGIMDNVDIESLSIDDLRIRVSELLEGHTFSDGTKLTIDDLSLIKLIVLL